MAAAGIYFTWRTKFAQVRRFPEACHLIMEKPENDAHVSSFQALMVSTASPCGYRQYHRRFHSNLLWRSGCCVLDVADVHHRCSLSALARIFKQRDDKGNIYGGPASYIEKAVKGCWLSCIFCFFLLGTYAFGFNLLCSYNLQSTFVIYPFCHERWTPLFIGIILAVLTAWCIFGGGNHAAG